MSLVHFNTRISVIYQLCFTALSHKRNVGIRERYNVINRLQLNRYKDTNKTGGTIWKEWKETAFHN